MASQHHRRRIDRVTSPEFLDGLAERTLDELRGMRDDCREEETRLSYARRVLQARLDIARAEQARRRGDEPPPSLVDGLPEILADEVSHRSGQPHARLSPVYAPTDEGRRAEDRLSEDATIGSVPDLDDAGLDALVDRLQGEETSLSSLRRTVLEALDRLQGELVARYREHADLDDILSAATRPPASTEGPDDPAGGHGEDRAG